MFRKIIRGLLAALIVVSLSSCTGGNPASETTESVKSTQATERIKISTTTTKALCTRLDYVGDRNNPTAATLTCQDGDKITIPGPFTKGMKVGEKNVLPDGSTTPGDDGIVFISSEQGKHHVWYYLVIDDGALRVFYDDQLIQPTSSGNSTSSKVVERNFSNDDVTSSIAWQ